MTRRALVIVVGLAAMMGAAGWWHLSKPEGCPSGSHAIAPITNGKTGEVIGAVCEHAK